MAGDVLARLSATALELGATRITHEARALAERVAEGRFYVVCIGQFKRGKSTLLNALAGTDVLPTGVVPVTTTVTILRYGEQPAARVRVGEEEWQPCDPRDLADYVSEERNPGNRKGVSVVEVFVPSPLLRDGMCLVDTPGLGSITEANALTTRAFVPQVDAALVVLGADPPVSGEELALVERVAAVTSRFVFVLNKADRVTTEERRQALAFAQRVLGGRLGHDRVRIFSVSATGMRDGVDERFDGSELVSALASLARNAGGDLVGAAHARGVARFAAALLVDIGEQRDALLRPLQDSEARVATLQDARQRAHHALEELGHRLTGVQEHLVRVFTERREMFLRRGLGEARREIETAMAAPSGDGPGRSRAIDLAIDLAARWLERWRADEEPRAQALYREATTRFAALVNETEAQLAVIPGLERLPRLPPESGFRVRSGLYYTTMQHVAPASPGRWFLDLFRTAAGRRRAIGRDAGDYVVRLLDVNTARITNDFIARVAESRRSLEADVRARLADVSASAERAVASAREAQASGAGAVQARLIWLDERRARVEEMVSASGQSESRARAPS